MKKSKKSVSQRNLVLLGLKNPQKKKIPSPNDGEKFLQPLKVLTSGIAYTRILKDDNSASAWISEHYNPIKMTAIITLELMHDSLKSSDLRIQSYG